MLCKNRLLLADWIEANMPDLATQLAAQPDLKACLRLLNEASGLSITTDENVEKTAPLILAALQAKSITERKS